jgi:hypothetical protein
MPRRTQHQLIWTTTENGAELRLPKNIKTDIGFQLMFGQAENYIELTRNEKKNAKNYECKVYRNLQHFKNHV